jgi:cytochrome c biogenesis protein CcmG, thiol:disulfide interchange protein DsbE
MRRPLRFWLGPVLVALIAVLVVFGVLQRPGRVTASVSPHVGHLAPSFTLADDRGRPVSLAAARGKVVLVNFWATWCAPCRQEMPVIDRLQRRFTGKLRVLAVDKEEPADAVRSYTRSLHLTLRPLLDSNGTVGNRYLVQQQPTSFWIDRSGVIRAIHYGPMTRSYAQREAERLLRA